MVRCRGAARRAAGGAEAATGAAADRGHTLAASREVGRAATLRILAAGAVTVQVPSTPPGTRAPGEELIVR